MESDGESESRELFRKSRTSSQYRPSLCWQNISVWNKVKTSQGIFQKTRYEDVHLLSNVSGFVSPGSLVAIMGPSGSGKTTLLATISYRLTERINGNVYLNGDITSRPEMLAISGFVPQEDISVESLTVYEHMSFMAILKMDKRIPEVDRLRKILSLMNQLGLDDCGSTHLKTLSGGQRKRLSIAVQMLTDPYILFCDEATTGLDSSNAAIVMKILRKFSSRGKIVICSIHQPASGVFELFDDVLLLATGGRVSYFGPVTEAVGYFERLQMKCPESYNIAEFLVKKISVSVPSDRERVKILCDVYSSSQQAADVKSQIQAACFDKYLSSEGGRVSFLVERKEDLLLSYQKHTYVDYKKTERVNLLIQIYYLIWRTLKNLSRNYINNIVHFFVYVSVALMVSSIYAKIVHNEKDRVQNIRGFINITVLETLYEFAYFVFNTFPSERHILLREIRGNLYTVEAYYMSKFICKTLYSIFAPLVFVGIVKWITDTFNYLSYLELAIPFCVIASLSTAYGCMLSAVFDNVPTMMAVAVAYEIPAYLFAGITLKISSLPFYLSWMKYLSTFYYAVQSVTVLEWKSIDLENIKRFNLTENDPAAFHSLEMVAEYGYSIMDYRYNLYILAMLIFLFHFVAYLSTAKKSKGQGAY
ncbi:protein scarlet-like [Planococcus citri]|uniref:protein scarlet-like n=1 Tax=Planococcus citri TaxID=170843 RepID=UPI0031F81A87